MTKLYQFNLLTVIKVSGNSVILDAGIFRAISLLDAPENTKSGDQLLVYLFRDSSEQVVAVMAKNQLQLATCSYLEVTDIGVHGAFLDWGLPKDLLLLHAEQTYPVELNGWYVVYVYLDQSARPVASMKLHQHLDESHGELQAGDQVDLLIADDSDLGFKAVINNQQLGLIYHDELAQPLDIGSKMKGWVKNVREDGKIDLNINVLDRQTRSHLEATILKELTDNSGFLALSDKSDPEIIFNTFKVSKRNFKAALGSLYKQRLIEISVDGIVLV